MERAIKRRKQYLAGQQENSCSTYISEPVKKIIREAISFKNRLLDGEITDDLHDHHSHWADQPSHDHHRWAAPLTQEKITTKNGK